MIRFLQSGNKAVKFMLAAFLLIICLSMLWYLIPSSGQDAGNLRSGVVVTVGDEEVKADDVNKMVAAQMQQQAARGQQLPPQFATFLRQQALQQLLQRAEIKYEADRMGLKVSDKEVQDELEHGMGKAYFFPEGKFIGKEKYEELLKLNGKTPAEFESEVRQQLVVMKMVATVGASVTASDTEIEEAFKERNTKIKFQYAVLNQDELTKQVKPTETELKAYFDATKQRYVNAIPEKRQVRYFVINDKDVESKVTVDPAEVQQYYATHQQQFKVADRMKVRHILITAPPPGPDGKVDQKAVDEARAKAEALLKQVKNGGNFAELAKKNSQDPGSAANGGDLGMWVQAGSGLVAEFEKAALVLKKGEISDVVKTQFGFHIIQATEREDAHTMSLAEAAPLIEPTLKAQKRSTLLETTSKQALELATKDGLDKAAAKYSATVIPSNPVTKFEALPGVGAAPALMEQIYASKENSVPQSARVATGYVYFQVSKVIPARTPALEDIHDRVAQDFSSGRSSELLRKKSQELADRAHAEHDLAKAAKEVGATFKTSELVDRSAHVPDLGSLSGPLAEIFTLKAGDISDPISMASKVVVVAVTERQEAPTSDPKFVAQRDQLRESLVQQRQDQAWRLFLEALGKRLETEKRIKINQTEFNNLTKLGS